MLNGVKRAVFFGAHTDDEMVCAGTLRRLVRQGCEVHVVTFGLAGVREDLLGGAGAARIALPEWHQSLDLIGVSERRRYCPYHAGPSVTLHERGQYVADFAFISVGEIKPDFALILSPDDENPAHAEVGRQCERVMRGRVPLVLRCQFPWNYSYGHGNVYVTLTPEDVVVKSAVCRAYKSQEFRYNYHDLFTAAARADGLSVKCEAAERFELVRGVV